MDAAIIEKEALMLPEAERALLVDRLLQSIGAEDQTRLGLWTGEAERRLQAIRGGQLQTEDADVVLKRLRAKTGG